MGQGCGEAAIYLNLLSPKLPPTTLPCTQTLACTLCLTLTQRTTWGRVLSSALTSGILAHHAWLAAPTSSLLTLPHPCCCHSFTSCLPHPPPGLGQGSLLQGLTTPGGAHCMSINVMTCSTLTRRKMRREGLLPAGDGAAKGSPPAPPPAGAPISMPSSSILCIF